MKRFYTRVLVLLISSAVLSETANAVVTHTAGTLTSGCFDTFHTTIAGTWYDWDFTVNAIPNRVTGAAVNTASTAFIYPGTYKVMCTITTGLGPVRDSLTVNVTAGSGIMTLTATMDTFCVGQQVTYAATPAGMASYAFFIDDSLFQNNGANSLIANGIMPGDSVKVLGFNGTCYTLSTVLFPVVYPIPPAPTLTSSIANDTICSGQLVVFTATPPGSTIYNFYNGGSLQQNTGSNTWSTTQLGQGNSVHVTVTVNGCTSNWSNVINTFVKPVPFVIANASATTICQGTPVTITATPAGLDSYDFTINSVSVQNNTSNTYTSSGFVTGDTIVVLATSNGCPAPATFPIIMTVNPVPSVTLTVSSNPACQGANVTFTASPAGYTTYQFYSGVTILQTGASNIYTTNTLSNNDSVTVIAINNGCTSAPSATIIMTITTNPVVNAGPDVTMCSNDTALTMTGFSPAGGIWTGTGIINPNGVFDPSVSGAGSFTLTYSITNTGCTGADSAVYTVNQAPSVTLTSDAVNNTICQGTLVTFTANPAGNTMYMFFSGATVLQAGASNTYSTTGLNNDDSIAVTVMNNGCSATSATIITIVDTVPVVTAGPDSVMCSNATAFAMTGFTPAGGIWTGTGITNPSGTFDPAVSGAGSFSLTYTVTNSGCAAADSVLYTVNQTPTVTLTSSSANDTICQGTPVTFTASPAGYTTYQFYSGAITLQNTGSNTYTTNTLQNGDSVTVIAINNGCPSPPSATIVMTVGAVVVVDAGNDSTMCSDVPAFSITGTPAGGIWTGTGITNPNGTFDPSSAVAGNNTITYSVDNNGCISADSVVYTVNQTPTVTLTSSATNDSICAGSTITFTATPAGYNTYQFYSGAIILQNTTSNTYTTTGLQNGDSVAVIAINNGCSSAPTAAIITTVSPVPIVVAGNNAIMCGNDTVVIMTGFSPAGGNWTGTGITNTNGAFDPNIAGAGNHTLTYTFSNGACSGSDSVVYTVNPVPTITLPVSVDICAGQSTVLNALSNGTTFVWSPITDLNSASILTPTATPAQTTTYTLHVSNSFQCSDSASIVVNVNPNPIADFSISPVCLGVTSVFINNSSPAGNIYAWSFGDGNTSTDPSPSHTYLAADSFNVTLIAQLGNCFDTVSQTTTVYPAAVANFDATPLVSYLDGISTVNFTDHSTNANLWNWDFGDGNASSAQSPSHPYTHDGIYTITLIASNTFGCSDTAVKVNYITVYETPRVFVPNAFSPNGDGNNDILYVMTSPTRFFDFSIFNRWGEKIFESNNQTEGWEGTYKGTPQVPGVYVYYLKVVFDDGSNRGFAGSVTLIK